MSSLGAIWKRLGRRGASFFASSLCCMWGDPLPCLFVQLSPGRRKGLYSRALRGEPTQTVLLKLDFWYTLNNNGFTRREFFSSLLTTSSFSRNWNQTHREERNSSAQCATRERGREREGKWSEPALFTNWWLLHILSVTLRDALRWSTTSRLSLIPSERSFLTVTNLYFDIPKCCFQQQNKQDRTVNVQEVRRVWPDGSSCGRTEVELVLDILAGLITVDLLK